MYRGYDSPQIFREDTIKRVLWLDSELSKIQSKISSQKTPSDDDNGPNANNDDKDT